MAKKPEAYVPPDYGVRNLAIERRMEGRPPADLREGEQKAEKAPLNKMAPAPDNKAEAPALSSMTKAELIDVAEAGGVEIETDDNKADLVRKIEKARKG